MIAGNIPNMMAVDFWWHFYQEQDGKCAQCQQPFSFNRAAKHQGTTEVICSACYNQNLQIGECEGCPNCGSTEIFSEGEQDVFIEFYCSICEGRWFETNCHFDPVTFERYHPQTEESNNLEPTKE